MGQLKKCLRLMISEYNNNDDHTYCIPNKEFYYLALTSQIPVLKFYSLIKGGQKTIGKSLKKIRESLIEFFL